MEGLLPRSVPARRACESGRKARHTAGRRQGPACQNGLRAIKPDRIPAPARAIAGPGRGLPGWQPAPLRRRPESEDCRGAGAPPLV